MNCPRARAIQIQNRTRAAKLTAMNEYRQVLIREKQARRSCVMDSRKYYKLLNDTRKPFESAVAMCRASNGQLLTNKDQMLSIRKEYFEQNFNRSSEENLHTNQESPRGNDVIIDLPNRQEFRSRLEAETAKKKAEEQQTKDKIHDWAENRTFLDKNFEVVNEFKYL
jgi:hypothetical protein